MSATDEVRFPNTFANFLALAPNLRLTPLLMPIALLGEGSLAAWLLVKGINVTKWNDESRPISQTRAT